MEAGLAALRTIDLLATMTAMVVLVAVMVQIPTRKWVYAPAFAYFLHSLIYQAALLYVSSINGDLGFFAYWAVGLRMNVTIMVASYGVYFTRLYQLRR